MALSRRDGAIVAWHEVPGTTPPQKTRPVGYGLIRPGLRADWSAEISNTKTEKFMLYDLFQQTVYDIEPGARISSDTNLSRRVFSLKKYGAHFDENTAGFAGPIIRYPTGKTLQAWKRAEIEYFNPDRLEAYPTLRRRPVTVGTRRRFEVHSNHR